jgi:membrane protein DedA with SNARE-associated domain
MLLETSSLPIPSEVILPFAGYLSYMGQFNFWLVVAVATVAGIFGSLIDYYIGLKAVQALVRNKVLGKVILSTAQLELAERWFERYGILIIFVSRLIPGFRTTFSFPAGAAKMPLKKFLAFTTAGCLLWNIILVYLGWYLGKNWTAVAGISRYLIVVSVAAAPVIIVVYLIVRKRKMAEQKGLVK